MNAPPTPPASVPTNDVFGSAPRPEHAAAGSYGERPPGYRLPDATRLGRVRLQVADIARSLEFYGATLGLRVLGRSAGTALLGARGDDTVLVELVERPGVQPAGRGLLGLYHFAILLPDRPALGRFVRHLGDIGVRAAGSDHLVSEAFYLHDPDGLGIEVYADRPRAAWQRLGRELMLATDPVDVADLLASAGESGWEGMPDGTVIGHVHLHVGNLARATAFFCDALGFDRMTWRYPGALFLGAGGYHHHVGANSWAGAGARPPSDGDARLLAWTLELPTPADVEAATQSLRAAGHLVEDHGGQAHTRDPWGAPIVLRAARTADVNR